MISNSKVAHWFCSTSHLMCVKSYTYPYISRCYKDQVASSNKVPVYKWMPCLKKSIKLRLWNKLVVVLLGRSNLEMVFACSVNIESSPNFNYISSFQPVLPINFRSDPQGFQKKSCKFSKSKIKGPPHKILACMWSCVLNPPWSKLEQIIRNFYIPRGWLEKFDYLGGYLAVF